MVAGCKCPGSCACKIKKPRKPKALKKAVVGGRVKQPQIVIQGMPPVSTTAIPQGYPYLTVTSDADLKPKAKSIAKSIETQTEIMAQPEIKEERVRGSGKGRGPEIRVEPIIGFMPGMLASGKGRGPEIGEGVSELKGESRFLTKPELKTPSQQLSLLKSKIAAGTTKQFAPKRMTTEAQTNLIEHVGVGTQATKETKEMGTETEPLLVTVAKGAKADIFNIMKEQEATGKIVSLTGAGRPARPFNESFALASPSPSPSPAPVAVPIGSASSSEGVPGYTEVRPRTTEMRTLPTGVPGALYKINLPARVVQMPPEIIDLS